MISVYIGFSSPKKFKIGSAVIKAYMKTPYSHVYLKVYSSYTGQWLVYQASHGVVHLLTLENFLETNQVYKEFERPINASDLRQCVKTAQGLLARPYGYLGLLKLVLRLPGDGIKSFHCSEFVATLFPDVAEKINVSPDHIQPVHLFKALEGEL